MSNKEIPKEKKLVQQKFQKKRNGPIKITKDKNGPIKKIMIISIQGGQPGGSSMNGEAYWMSAQLRAE